MQFWYNVTFLRYYAYSKGGEGIEPITRVAAYMLCMNGARTINIPTRLRYKSNWSDCRLSQNGARKPMNGNLFFFKLTRNSDLILDWILFAFVLSPPPRPHTSRVSTLALSRSQVNRANINDDNDPFCKQ
jgi:hypothetical protein